ncbi:MAG: hypothetical protein ACRYGM_13325 [Janthinobacterium lividum]
MKLALPVLLLLLAVQAPIQAQIPIQAPSPRSFGPGVLVGPLQGGGRGGIVGDAIPFAAPQFGPQPLLGPIVLDGLDPSSLGGEAAPGCLYAGQAYSEGAVIRNDAGRQVCGPRRGAVPDASGQVPLGWRFIPGG